MQRTRRARAPAAEARFLQSDASWAAKIATRPLMAWSRFLRRRRCMSARGVSQVPHIQALLWKIQSSISRHQLHRLILMLLGLISWRTQDLQGRLHPARSGTGNVMTDHRRQAVGTVERRLQRVVTWCECTAFGNLMACKMLVQTIGRLFELRCIVISHEIPSTQQSQARV